MHNEDTGQVMRNPAGEPFLRMAGNLPPCRLPRKAGGGCDKGIPEHNLNHTPENILAYRHWRECKAVGDWPRGSDGEIDPIVKRNAAILEEAEADVTREEWTRFRMSALQILQVTNSVF